MDVQIEVPRKLSAGDSSLSLRVGTGIAAPSTTVAGSNPAAEVSSPSCHARGSWERCRISPAARAIRPGMTMSPTTSWTRRTRLRVRCFLLD